MWQLAAVLYLITGIVLVTFTRARAVMKEKLRDTDFSKVPRWKIVLFYILIYSGCILLWPVFLKSWFSEKPKTALDALNENQEINDLKELFEAMKELSNSGIDADEFPDGTGEFGLELTNPVPCNTVYGSQMYLSNLRTEDGEEIKYERIGSFSSELLPEPIDGYQIFNQNGEELSVIYISPYQKHNSNKAPRGYCLSSY